MTAAPPSSSEVEALIVGGRIDRLLAHARAATSPSMRRWMIDALERALLRADPGAVSAAQREEAISVGASAGTAAVADVEPPPHAVLVPFAPIADGAGIVRMLHVSRRALGARDELALGAQSREAVRHALELAVRLARRDRDRDPSWYCLRAAQPDAVAALRIEGGSLGAAVLVSAVALLTDRRVRPGTVITGKLTATGIDVVGGLEQKLDGAFEGRADVRRVIVPSRNAPLVDARERGVDVIGVATHGELLEAALEPATPSVRPERAVEAARAAFERGWQGWLWPAQHEPLERLAGELPAERPDLRVEVLTLLAAVKRHLGAPDASLSVLKQALEIVESDDGREAVPDRPLTELYQHLALTFQKLCRFEEATAAADRAVEVARAGRLRGEQLEAHGCAGLVALARGAADVAVSHQREALRLVHLQRPQSCPRTHGYLIEALGRRGDLEAARAQYREGLEHLEARPRDGHDTREAWLRTSFASALAHHGGWSEILELLEAPPVRRSIASDPLPGLLARRWLGLARAASGAREEGWSLLAASPAAYGRLMPHVAFLAHSNVLFEARSRLEAEAFSDDTRGRAIVALAAFPQYGESPRFFGGEVRATERALYADDPLALHAALERLLDRAQRL